MIWDKIKVVPNTVGHTPTIWMDDPAKEQVCEETADEGVLMKDKNEKVIGFEMLYYAPADGASGLAGETVVHIGA